MHEEDLKSLYDMLNDLEARIVKMKRQIAQYIEAVSPASGVTGEVSNGMARSRNEGMDKTLRELIRPVDPKFIAELSQALEAFENERKKRRAM